MADAQSWLSSSASEDIGLRFYYQLQWAQKNQSLGFIAKKTETRDTGFKPDNRKHQPESGARLTKDSWFAETKALSWW